MDIQLLERGAFGWALVKLSPGEEFVSESGAMFRASSDIDIDVTTRSGKRGGLLAGLKRTLAAESFFLSTYRCSGQQDGEIGLAPTMQGEVALINCDGDGIVDMCGRELPGLSRWIGDRYGIPGVAGNVLRRVPVVPVGLGPGAAAGERFRTHHPVGCRWSANSRYRACRRFPGLAGVHPGQGRWQLAPIYADE